MVGPVPGVHQHLLVEARSFEFFATGTGTAVAEDSGPRISNLPTTLTPHQPTLRPHWMQTTGNGRQSAMEM